MPVWDVTGSSVLLNDQNQHKHELFCAAILQNYYTGKLRVEKRQLYTVLLPNNQTTVYPVQGIQWNSAETHFSCLFSISFFQTPPMDQEKLDGNWQKIQLLFLLSLHYDCLVMCINLWGSCSLPTNNHFVLPQLRRKTLKYLNSSSSGCSSLPLWRRQSSYVWFGP